MKKVIYCFLLVFVFVVGFNNICYALFGKHKPEKSIETYKKKEVDSLLNDFYSEDKGVVSNSSVQKDIDSIDKQNKSDLENTIKISDNDTEILFCPSCKRQFDIDANIIFCPYDGEKLRIRQK